MAVIIGSKYTIVDVDQILEKVNDISQDMGVEIQILDAGLVFGKEHLIVAVEKAERAFSQSRNISKSIPTEVLLYAGAERQISKAIQKMGIKADLESLAIIIHGDVDPDIFLTRMGWQCDDTVLEPDIGRASEFGIMAQVDESNITDLVLERMGLSELDR